MKDFSQFFTLLILFFASQSLNAQCCANASCCETPTGWSSHRADGNAPIGVMGDHYHGQGGLMFSYRFMNMAMEGNRSGTESINDAAVLQDYMMAPQRMDMQMHMFGAMYALSNRITLMGMTNYLFNEMEMSTMDGMTHLHESSGLGDTKLSAVAGVFTKERHAIHLNAGLNIPTGSITEMEPGIHMEGHHHHGDSRIPYAMQLGSGTWDLQMGATYLGQADRISWGAQILGNFPTGENSEDYRIGNRYQLTSWAALRANDWMSVSVRTEGFAQEKMIGKDSEMVAMMSPTSDADNFGGEQVSAFAGLNFYVPEGTFSGLRFGLEYGLPFYQNWNGIQMERQSSWTLGVKYGWH